MQTFASKLEISSIISELIAQCLSEQGGNIEVKIVDHKAQHAKKSFQLLQSSRNFQAFQWWQVGGQADRSVKCHSRWRIQHYPERTNASLTKEGYERDRQDQPK